MCSDVVRGTDPAGSRAGIVSWYQLSPSGFIDGVHLHTLSAGFCSVPAFLISDGVCAAFRACEDLLFNEVKKRIYSSETVFTMQMFLHSPSKLLPQVTWETRSGGNADFPSGLHPTGGLCVRWGEPVPSTEPQQPVTRCPRWVPSMCSLMEHIQPCGAAESPQHGRVSASCPDSYPSSAGKEATSQASFSPGEPRGNVQTGRCAAALWAGSSSQW